MWISLNHNETRGITWLPVRISHCQLIKLLPNALKQLCFLWTSLLTDSHNFIITIYYYSLYYAYPCINMHHYLWQIISFGGGSSEVVIVIYYYWVIVTNNIYDKNNAWIFLKVYLEEKALLQDFCQQQKTNLKM